MIFYKNLEFEATMNMYHKSIMQIMITLLNDKVLKHFFKQIIFSLKKKKKITLDLMIIYNILHNFNLKT